MSQSQRKFEYNWILELWILGLAITVFLALYTYSLLWMILVPCLGLVAGIAVTGIRSMGKYGVKAGKGGKVQCENLREKLEKDARTVKLYGSLINIGSIVFLVLFLILLLI